MTLDAIRSKASRSVARIRRGVEVRLMATDAGERRVGKLPVRVTLLACRRLVRAGQRKSCPAVIKRCRTPSGLGVAGLTCGREISSDVVGIGCCVKGVTMACYAVGRLSNKHVIAVAIGALLCLMCAEKRKARLVMIEPGARPRACALMTGLAVRRESRSRVIRACGSGEIHFMAGDALRRRCELRFLMHKPSPPHKRCYLMALRAIGGKPGRNMVRRKRPPEIILVATEAIRRRSGKLLLSRVRVTGLARQCRVLAEQRKPRRLVLLNHVGNLPRLRGVAAKAIRPQLAFVNVGVARETIGGFGCRKLQSLVARFALDGLVRAREREPGDFMIDGVPVHFPGIR